MKKSTKTVLIVGAVITALYLLSKRSAAAKIGTSSAPADAKAAAAAGQPPYAPDPFGKAKDTPDLDLAAWMTGNYAKAAKAGPQNTESPTDAQLDFMESRM